MMMIADTVTAAKSLCILRAYQFSIADSSSDQISAMIHPCDAVAPPPVKPSTHRIPRRTLTRRKRRTRRKLSGDDNGGEGLFFGDGGDGIFGGGGGGFGGGGGGGGDWNFNRFGEGENWDERSSSLQDPAFDFVYRVLSWIMLSNCLHFAVKKIVRIIADGSIVDSDREKVPTRLAPIC